jgi:exodeoxyribonuclease VII large subunit
VAQRAPQLLDGDARHLDHLEARVRALDPVHALARGWSITRTGDGHLVRRPADVAAGDELVTTLAAGTLRSRVEEESSP